MSTTLSLTTHRAIQLLNGYVILTKNLRVPTCYLRRKTLS